MDNTVGDILHCEEQLRTTLHCDDKEKLRRKLLLLQREYVRTAQRLQRAERSEAVRRHVKSRIAQQNKHQNQGEQEVRLPCVNPSSPTSTTTNGTATGIPQCKGHTGDSGDSQNSGRSQSVRFLLPSEAACPQTSDHIDDTTRSHRPSPALRLRSRRSRLRLEKTNAEATRSTNSSENGPTQNEAMNAPTIQIIEEEVRREETDVMNESEELFSGTESESPSLLLTHWNSSGQNHKGDVEGQGVQEQSDRETDWTAEEKKESEHVLLTCCNPVIHTEGRVHEGTQNKRNKRVGIEEGEDSQGQMNGRLCEGNSNTVQMAEERQCEKRDNTVEIKENKSKIDQGEHNLKGVGLLDSCTLVDGLLFPAEYYVRTTRRMTSSQSQPDMQAVILSQLNVGRYRRSRGRGRSVTRLTRDQGDTNQQFALGGPTIESQEAETSAELRTQFSSENSNKIPAGQIKTDACFFPTTSTPRPARGQRRRRGRGRGRRQTPRCSFSLDTPQLGLEKTSAEPQLKSSQVSSSPSLHEADGSYVSTGEDDTIPGDPESVTTPVGSGAKAIPASSHQIYPIFLKNNGGTNKSTQISRSSASCQSLLLPSSPASASPLPRLSLSLGCLMKNLINSDVQQDFHLPDDQFASLKLHKLHQVAAEAGVEQFTSTSHNTRRSIRKYESFCRNDDAMPPLPVPLNPTPTISESPDPTDGKHNSALPVEHELTELSDRENSEDQKTEGQVSTTSTESVSEIQECAADRVCKEDDTVILNSHCQVKTVFPQDQINCNRLVHPEKNHGSTNNHAEDKALIKSLSFENHQQRTPEESSNTCRATHACSDTEAPAESAVQRVTDKCATEINESSDPIVSPLRETKNQKYLPQHSIQSQLLLSPPLASALLTAPHLYSSALHSSPTLPSLGITPQPGPAALPLTSSPSAPTLILPPPYSPSTQALSPPALSPCPSLARLLPCQPPAYPDSEVQASCEPRQSAESTAGTTESKNQSECSYGQVGLRNTETTEDPTIRCMHTLKSPAGGCLVDACCLPGPSGGLCVAAAGKWAVCLWSQTTASDWSISHTWSFSELVINVFPVPDAAGLICVTLGRIEIREVRILSCSSLLQTLLCHGLVQAVAGVSDSRVVTSSHSESGSTLQVFTLSHSGSTLSSQPLVSPDVCVGAFSQVYGLPDALIGTDDGGHLFIWNLKTGQLLQTIHLEDGLSHTACLRGYSYCGVLFVLLQHQLLSFPEEEGRDATEKRYQILLEDEERKKMALLSLVAINPLARKSIVATQLYPPSAWSGRLCEADVDDCSVVGLSQSGCVCVWELGRRGTTRMVKAPENEGWQLARWGGGGMLVTGHHNGDVTLHCYSKSQTSLYHS